MQHPRRGLAWRPVFYVAVLIGTPVLSWFARPSADRTDGARWTYVSVWIGLAVLYALLAWRTRASSREQRRVDILVVVVFAIAAIFEANWPGRLPNFTPDTIAGVGAASALVAYSGMSARKRHDAISAAPEREPLARP